MKQLQNQEDLQNTKFRGLLNHRKCQLLQMIFSWLRVNFWQVQLSSTLRMQSLSESGINDSEFTYFNDLPQKTDTEFAPCQFWPSLLPFLVSRSWSSFRFYRHRMRTNGHIGLEARPSFKSKKIVSGRSPRLSWVAQPCIDLVASFIMIGRGYNVGLVRPHWSDKFGESICTNGGIQYTLSIVLTGDESPSFVSTGDLVT